MKQMLQILSAVIVCFLFTNCSECVSREGINYNSSQKDCYTYGEWHIQWSEDASSLLRVNTNNHETLDLLGGWFPSQRECVSQSFYGWGDSVYVLLVQEEQEELVLPFHSQGNYWISLIKISLKDASTKIILEMRQTDSEKVSAFYTDTFFLNQNRLFLCTDNGVEVVDLCTSQLSLLSLPVQLRFNMAFDGTNIYYKSEDDTLMQYNIDTRNISSVSDLIVSDFILYNHSIYFLNRQDDNTIYQYDFLTGNNQRIVSVPSDTISIVDKQLVFSARESGINYCSNLDGSNIILSESTNTGGV